MSLIETESVPRRTMNLFFLIDTSGSMEGNKGQKIVTKKRRYYEDIYQWKDRRGCSE